MAEEQRKRRPRRKFSPEFKRDAVELVQSTGRPIADVAAELGLYDSTLGSWVRQAQVGEGERDGITSDERAELAELRAELVKTKSGPPVEVVGR